LGISSKHGVLGGPFLRKGDWWSIKQVKKLMGWNITKEKGSLQKALLKPAAEQRQLKNTITLIAWHPILAFGIFWYFATLPTSLCEMHVVAFQPSLVRQKRDFIKYHKSRICLRGA
jgi:hypothetical protein